MIEKKLTLKQQAFADYYIELGNATEAAIKAGYSQKYAAQNTDKLLKNTNVSAYIENRMNEIQSQRIANQEEVMELLTAVLRGEARSAVLRGIGEGAQVIEEYMPPTTAERIRAAELIGKRYALFTDKQEINATVTPIFVDDISGDNNGS